MCNTVVKKLLKTSQNWWMMAKIIDNKSDVNDILTVTPASNRLMTMTMSIMTDQ